MVTHSPASVFATQDEYLNAVATARAAAVAYYETEQVVMDDATYDTFVRSIAATEDAHPDWAASGGLVDQVAGGTSSGGEVEHRVPMLSLDNAMDGDELNAWFARFDQRCADAGFADAAVCVEPKLDGLAVSARYTDGTLVQVATRGDGRRGEDVTGRTHQVSGLPWTLNDSFTGEVRGEIYMTDDDFAAANELRIAAGKASFVNPRNAAAGALRNEKSEVRYPLHFACYDLVDADAHDDAMGTVEALGIATARQVASLGDQRVVGAAAVTAVIAGLGARRATLGFAIDGAVVKAADGAVRTALGITAKAPRWAIAFKYPADARTTVVNAIVVQVGRTGVLTPVAELEPVFVGGTTITRATLSNPGEVARKDVRVGDTVWVRRAGEVIPEIVAVDTERRPAGTEAWTAPTACPRCSGSIDMSSKRWRCDNRGCGRQEALTFFASRAAMDIDGLGDHVVARLIDAGLVEHPSDLYRLTVDDVSRLERMGAQSAANLIEQIERSKQRPVAAVVCGLGIGTVGAKLARVLVRRYPTLDALRGASVDDVAELDGFGPHRATTVADDLVLLDDEIGRLSDLGVGVADIDAGTPAGPLSGKQVVVTGSIPGLDRAAAEALVEQLGGRVLSSVSSRCDLVVYGDKAGSKLAKAQTLGVETMDADTFAALAGGAAQRNAV
jgi:DNA ligase (NAD+)